MIMLNLGFHVSSQNINKDKVFILIDSVKYHDLFIFKHQGDTANMKILMFHKKDEGFKLETQQSSADDDIVVVGSQPPETNYYEFYSYKEPEEIINIDMLNIYSIEDISKNEMKVWGKSSNNFHFIQNLNNGKHFVFEMHVLMQE